MLQIRRTLLWMVLLSLSESENFLNYTGIIGRSILLPCTSESLAPQSVLWRDGSDRELFSIEKNKTDLQNQDQKYKGRISSFPDQYQKNNYSIIMKDLTENDTGIYECSVIFNKVPQRTKVNLTVVEFIKAAGFVSTPTSTVLLLTALPLLV